MKGMSETSLLLCYGDRNKSSLLGRKIAHANLVLEDIGDGTV